MKNSDQPENNIEKLCKERGISARQLAKKIEISPPQMSRLINGQAVLSIKWLLKIAAALEVQPTDIVELPMNKKFIAKCDAALLGSIIGWLLEASAQFKVVLSKEQLSNLTSFIYNEVAERGLNFNETRHLTFAAVKVKDIVS